MQYVGLLVKYVCHALIIDDIPFEAILIHQKYSSRHSRNLEFVNELCRVLIIFIHHNPS